MNMTPHLQEKDSAVNSGHCEATDKASTPSCKLTSAGFRKRKETVIAGLKRQVLQKKELKNGYAYKFTGTDKMIDELTEFIKTERRCCDFFIFHLSISGDKSNSWLKITGTKAAKEFIKTELDM